MAELIIAIEDILPAVSGKNLKLVTFQGQLDTGALEQKKQVLDELIQKYPANLYLLLDFEKLEYINSRGIGYLAESNEKLAAGNGRIVIARPTANVYDILKVVGLENFIKTFPSIEEARKELIS